MATVLVWGGSFAAIKALVDHGLATEDVALVRYLIAAPGFLLVLWRAGGLPALTRTETVRIVVAGLMVVAVYHLALNAGEQLTTSGTASVVVASAPGMTLALALALGMETYVATRVAGLAVAFAGVVVVVALGSGQRVSFAGARGPLLVLAAPAAFAAYNLLLKPVLPRVGALAATAAASLAGTVALVPLGLLGTAGRISRASTGDWLLLAYLGLACTLAGYVAWTWGLSRLDASRTVAYLYGVPVTAVAVGALTLGEPVSGWLVAGAVLVVGGVAVAQ